MRRCPTFLSVLQSYIPFFTRKVDKKLARMYARVRKHLGASSLAFRVWDRLYEQLMAR
jgi:hypothetical protein